MEDDAEMEARWERERRAVALRRRLLAAGAAMIFVGLALILVGEARGDGAIIRARIGLAFGSLLVSLASAGVKS